MIFKHGLRASLTPIVTMFGLDIALLVGGAIITESVFNLQGLGWLAINDALQQDLPIVLGVVLVAPRRRRVREPGRRHPLRVPRPARPLRVTAACEPSDTPSGARTLLDVRDLTVRFPTARRRRPGRLGRLASRCRRGETLGVVGESGSGKSVSNLAIMGLLNRSAREITGEVVFEGRDLLELPPDELRKIRGKDIAMIFQDPFACLHPMYRVGAQIAEAVPAHADVAQEGRLGPRRRAARRTSASRTRSRAPATTRTSSRAACASAR